MCIDRKEWEREREREKVVKNRLNLIFVIRTQLIMLTIDHREWNKLFPVDTSTGEASALFIQRLFTVTLSALTAKRQIFSDDHFSSKKLGPLTVPLFTRPGSLIEQQKFNKTIFSWVRQPCVLSSDVSELVNVDSRCIASHFE